MTRQRRSRSNAEKEEDEVTKKNGAAKENEGAKEEGAVKEEKKGLCQANDTALIKR